MAEYRTLEIKVKSARHLQNVNIISKMDSYVVVSSSGDPRTKHKSPVDRVGGTNPTWDFLVKFTVDVARDRSASVTFALRCERALGADKDIGEVHVPIADLLNNSDADQGKHCHVAYQVRKPCGKPKGELNFSYRWGEKVMVSPSSEYLEENAITNGKYDEPVTAYPVAGSNSAYYQASPAPSHTYPPPSSGGYEQQYLSVVGYGHPPQHGGYEQQYPPVVGYGEYPPQTQYGGYPPPPGPGYGYPSYGYPPMQQPAPRKNNKSGLGSGAGLLGGAIGGLLLGNLITDIAFD